MNGWKQIAVILAFQQIRSEIDQHTKRLRSEIGGSAPCPVNCFDCCHNTATISISAVEAEDLKIGLKKLDPKLRAIVLEKAENSIGKLEAVGFTEKKIREESDMTAIDQLKGSREAECPMLIGGVCSVYDHRPVICRVWGYPIDNGNELACCWKTFIGRTENHEPIPYHDYWEKCRDLSENAPKARTPNCYLVKQILTELKSESD